MTCPHCGFENQEANVSCFRCGQALSMDDVEVVPERLKRGTPSSGLLERFHVWRNRRGQGRRRDAPPRRQAAASAALSLVPGLGHSMMGYPRRAAVMLGLWVASIGVTWLTDPPLAPVPELVADWLLHPRWLPLAVHSFIMADAYQLRLRQRGVRADLGELMVVSLLATALLFGPRTLDLINAAAGYEAAVVVPAVTDPSVAQGDTLLFYTAAPPAVRRGMVLRFRFNGYGGQAVGTVQAVTGDVVEWKGPDRLLTVNGRPMPTPEWLALPGSERLVLERGEFLMLSVAPYGFRSMRDLVVREAWADAVVVRITDPPHRRKTFPTR